ncbi:hypothetical protein [Oscillatoria salina]|uniref:hypothetical protein n=1 Tax=Oscillatoria salina TaxID=331517 RepID=UPI0013B9386B|nr:hypothetical protein [Oscillatoria salina]MBZ8180054.1 hypothetical protein [Oscillatoria salina IIICB1]NET88896.1 hypothetical protein [Kamptonema sp. SIO1D9]
MAAKIRVRRSPNSKYNRQIDVIRQCTVIDENNREISEKSNFVAFFFTFHSLLTHKKQSTLITQS